MSDPSLLSLDGTLEKTFPGLTVLDHDLELSERFQADLVAMERSGRLVFVLLVEGRGDEPLLAAFEALSFARHNANVLGAHFEEPRLRTDLPPRVLMIAQSFGPDFVERVRPLAQSVDLYEVRQLKSARGENVFLSAVGGRPLPAERLSRDGFLAGLAPDARAIARHCLERMARVDDELQLDASADRLAWSFRGAELARLELLDGSLRGAVAPSYEERVLRSAAQVELFIEEALGRYVQSLGGPAAPQDAPAFGSAVPPAPSTPPSAAPESAAIEDLEPLPPEEAGSGLSSLESEPLLSPEEIRAFQE